MCTKAQADVLYMSISLKLLTLMTLCLLAFLHVELGTRPGLSGQTLVSTGLADFDKLLGGGLPLGTVTLLLEDSYTQHHLTLLKYFLAEGAANSQALQWIVGQGRHSSAAKMLPQQVNYVPKVIQNSENCHVCHSHRHLANTTFKAHDE